MLVIATAALFGMLTAEPWVVPRTPDGKPDLQGIWTNATVTPLERPRELGAREVYTDEEMEAVRKDAAVPVPTAVRGGTEAHYDFTQFGLDRTQMQLRSEPWVVPRTPDGKPDLQGIWTNATVTPLERPRELGAREVYTDEEMEAVRKDAAVPVPTAVRGGTEAHYDFTQFGLDRTQMQL